MQTTSLVLKEKLKEYKQKYYLNQLIKGLIFAFALILSAFVFVNILEYWLRFGMVMRSILFFGFLGLFIYALTSYIIIPLYRLTNNHVQISDDEAAKQIGKYFPEVKDKLLNILQLEKLETSENQLIAASIEQKSNSISLVPFASAIDLSLNKKYIKYALAPALLIMVGLIFIPQLFTEGTNRIVNFTRKFREPAPFDFLVQNENLTSFRNEDFVLKLKIKGKALPEQVYLVYENRKLKMEKIDDENYQFVFSNIQHTTNFEFEASGFSSDMYTLEMMARPNLADFDLQVEYPSYIGKTADQFQNIGNVTVPEGSTVTWILRTESSDSALINFDGAAFSYKAVQDGDNAFVFKKLIDKTHQYSIRLKNENFYNKEKIEYSITSIPDQNPSINLEHFRDTVFYNFIVVAGNIADDYGFTGLHLCYKTSKQGNYKSIPLKVSRNQLSQSYYYRWAIDSLKLAPGEQLEYYLKVTDNDGFNGPKSTKSEIHQLKMPSADLIAKDLEQSMEKSEQKLDKTLDKAIEMKKAVKKLEDKIKGKKNLSIEDKKQIEDLLKQHEELKKQVENMQEQTENTFEKKKRFDQSKNEELAEKHEEIQKLLNELLDDETKKMMEELQKMLAEKNKDDQIKQNLEKLKDKDEDLSKDLERTLEMLKQMKFEDKLEKNIDKLNDLAQKQEQLSKESEKPNANKDELLEKQNELNKEFKEFQKEQQELSEINKTLENKHDLEENQKSEESIEQEQQQSSEQLSKNQKNKASKSQKSAANKMNQMAQKMAQMQQQMQNQEAEENIETLRAILENLLKLSFDQEELMKNFKNVNQNDPRYVQLGQAQLKLRDDSRVIEDSLFALSKRVVKIKSFITKEVGLMNDYIEEAVQAIKSRRSDVAAAKQQYAMTSINNLALMLSDALKQMQNDMASSKSSGDGQCKNPGKKKGGKGKIPNLGDLQKQLNDQMKQLGKQGKSGSQMSEELAKMAARQQMIRNALKELEEQMNQDGKKAGGNLSKLKDEMEKTEEDLVNKQVTQKTIERQQEILTRLLEAEKSVREQDEEQKREAQQVKQQKISLPPSFSKYLKQKEKQVELLKTISPNFTQYFKQEVGDYFKKIEK